MEDREQESHSGVDRRLTSSQISPTTTSSSLQGNSTALLPPAVLQITSDQSCFSSGTYIVQVPRDQVYRVPPPGNASLAENHIRRERGKSSGSFFGFSSSSSILLFFVVIVLIIGAVLGSLLVIFLIYNNPGFSIEHFLVNQQKTNHNHLEYDIRMKVHNPNKYIRISYDQEDDESSNVILSSSYSPSSKKKNIEFASGKFPILQQGSKDSATVNVTVHGSRSQLPKEIAARMHSKTKTSLYLSMNVPVKFKVGALSVKSKKIHVSCSFLVDRFNKGARVVTQKCTTRG